MKQLMAGTYAEVFPELTALAQEPGSLYISNLSSKEIFGHLVGAEIVLTSEKYEWVFVEEYWIIDPRRSVESIQYEGGLPPKPQ